MRIDVRLDVIEAMLYFWKATSEREKVGESYMDEITRYKAMEVLYDENFSQEEVRMVLSAISNREMLNTTCKKSRKFWNNNMWMMEDLSYTDMMVTPLKVLNLDSVADQYKTEKLDKIEVHFVPGHYDVVTIKENKIIINFFCVKPDLYDEKIVTIEGKPLKTYIAEQIQNCVNGFK